MSETETREGKLSEPVVKIRAKDEVETYVNRFPEVGQYGPRERGEISAARFRAFSEYAFGLNPQVIESLSAEQADKIKEGRHLFSDVAVIDDDLVEGARFKYKTFQLDLPKGISLLVQPVNDGTHLSGFIFYPEEGRGAAFRLEDTEYMELYDYLVEDLERS